MNKLTSEEMINQRILCLRGERAMLATSKELGDKLLELEKKFAGHDTTIRHLVAAIRDLAGGTQDKRKRSVAPAG